MRIAQFNSTLLNPLGGAEQYCIELTKWLASNGHECVVFTGWISLEVREDLEANGIEVRVVKQNRPYAPNEKGPNLRAKLEFHGRDLLSTWSPSTVLGEMCNANFDVIHIHRFQGFGSGLLAGRGPIVHTVHDYALVDTTSTSARHGRMYETDPLVQRIRIAASNLSLRNAPMLIFPSERTMRRHLELGLRVHEGSAHVVPHGWRLGEPSHRFARSKKAFVFLYLGKLSTEKGVDLILDAWAEGVEGARLRIAGAGELAPRCKSLDGNFGIEYLGWLEHADRASALLTSDVLVMPSQLPENFPIVMIEAFLAGIPVLTTVEASPPLLRNGHTGMIVDSDAASLRSAFQEFRSSDGLLNKLRHGVRGVAVELDFDLHGRRITSMYERLVADYPSPSRLQGRPRRPRGKVGP